jgi:hypothetical protein
MENLDNIYGYTKELPKIIDMETCTIMLLYRQYPYQYLDEISKSFNVDGIDEKPKFKEGGVSWRYVVISRSADGINPIRPMFKNIDGKLVSDMPLFGSIAIRPPKVLFEKKDDRYRRIGSVYSKDGYPKITDSLPSAYPPKRDFNSKIDAENIPPGEEANYADLINVNNTRISQWQKTMDGFKQLDEEQALNTMEITLARKYLLCHVTDEFEKNNPLFRYVKPQKGLAFTTKVTYNGKYINLTPFKQLQEGKNWVTEYYSNCKVFTPDQDAILFADNLIAAEKAHNEEQRIAREEAKAAQMSQANPDILDDNEEEKDW